MTEAEWLTCDDASQMLKAICDGADERKIRLLALSCCRRVEYLLGAADVKCCRKAIAALESRIEGVVSERDLENALAVTVGEVMDAGHSIHNPGEAHLYAISYAAGTLECVRRGEWAVLTEITCEAIAYDSVARSGDPELQRIAARWRPNNRLGDMEWRRDVAAVQGLRVFVLARGTEQSNQAGILRDIFGNPFRPVAFSPEWRTSTVIALAKQMYESRDFSAMPILADALQDVGCDIDDILKHCRSDGPNIRGCWVVDLVLGKV